MENPLRNQPSRLPLIFVIALTCVGSVLGQPGSGTKYRVTSTMEVSGMSIPSRTMQMCTSKSGDASMVPTDKNCRVLDYRANANKSSFRMVCTGSDAMTGRGEFERLADGYRGRVVMNDPDANVNMTMKFEGKRIGDCDFDKESPQAQGQAMLKQQCDILIKSPSFGLSPAFFGPNAHCSAMRARYCAAMVPASNTPSFISQNGKLPEYWTAMQECGQPRATVVAQACRKASIDSDGNYIAEYCPELLVKACQTADVLKSADFIVNQCPARAEALSAEHCAGRSYTSMYKSPYAPFCNKVSSAKLEKRNGSRRGDGNGASGDVPDTQKKPSWKDKFKSIKDSVIGR